MCSPVHGKALPGSYPSKADAWPSLNNHTVPQEVVTLKSGSLRGSDFSNVLPNEEREWLF